MSALALALALALAASACGAAKAGGSSDAVVASPIAALFGWNDYDEVEGRRLDLEVQQLTATCMKAEGFEYVPVDWSAQQPAADDEDADLDWGSAEFGEKYGYGIMRNYEMWEADQIESEVTGTPIEDTFEDPNNDYVMTLSEAEQSAYYESLWGDQETTVDDEGNYIQRPLAEQGCDGTSRLAVYGEDIWAEPGLAAFFDAASTDLENDPRLAAAEDDWVTCMADPLDDLRTELDDVMEVAGVKISGPDDVYQALELLKVTATGQQILELDPVTGQPIGDFDDSNGWSSTQNADGTGYAMVGPRKPITADRIDEIQAVETTLWRQDQKCQKEVELGQIRNELEQELVDELLAVYPEAAKPARPDTGTDTGEG